MTALIDVSILSGTEYRDTELREVGRKKYILPRVQLRTGKPMKRRLSLCILSTLFITAVSTTVLAQNQEDSHDAVRPAPREGGWMKRHEAMNNRVSQGNVDLVFIGDSITQGWEGRGKKVWAEFYGDRNAVNLGIGGDRTQHVIWRLQNGNLKNIAPKAAVIMIGTNNSGSNTPVHGLAVKKPSPSRIMI
ncbi:GDSL-type esterase/lipase family protein [bacterium]|nr:GDSL-type esterase/lipase family protein [bacterium]